VQELKWRPQKSSAWARWRADWAAAGIKSAGRIRSERQDKKSNVAVAKSSASKTKMEILQGDQTRESKPGTIENTRRRFALAWQQNLSRKTMNETTSHFCAQNKNQGQDLGSGDTLRESRNLVGTRWLMSGNRSAKPGRNELWHAERKSKKDRLRRRWI
jgi:hypothetical protein